MDKAKSMRFQACLPQSWWEFSVEHATHVYNQTPLRCLNWRMPYELLNNEVPSVSHLRVFGCGAYVYLPAETRANKLAPKSEMMTYLGNAKGASRFTFMRLPNNELFHAAQCIFDEDLFPKCQTGPRQPLTRLYSNVPHRTHLHYEDSIPVDEEVPSPVSRIKQKQPEWHLLQQPERSPSPVAPPHEAMPPIPGGLPPSREPSPKQRAPSPVPPEAPLEWQHRVKKVPLQPGNVYGEWRHPVDILKPKNKRNWKKLEKVARKPCKNTPCSSSPIPGPSNQPQTDVEDIPLPSISPTPSELEIEGGLDYATDNPVVDWVCREGGVHLLSFLMAQAVSPTANATTDPKTWGYCDMTHLPIAEQKEWQDACLWELEALKRRNVFKLVERPRGCKVIKN